MKFKEAIYKIDITTISTDTIHLSDMSSYHKNSVPTYKVTVHCSTISKLDFAINKIDELNFFLDTIIKLYYHCDYDFESMLNVLSLVSKIHNLLWWDAGYMVESINNLVKEVTGFDLESI